MSEDTAHACGIDFGGGACRICLIEGADTPVFAGEEPGHRYLLPRSPAPAYLDGRGNHTPARQLAYEFASVKRHLGMEMRVRRGGNTLGNDEIVENDQIAAECLRKLREKAERAIGGEITGATVGVSPYFSDRQSAAAKWCAEMAGFQQVSLVDEARAAAMAYRHSSGTQGLWLIYGLGRSTFFTTLVAARMGMQALGSDGDTHLGGDDLDAMIVDLLAQQGVWRDLQDRLNDPAIAGQLLRLAEDCKKQLTTQSSAVCSQTVSDSEGRPYPVRFSLDRGVLERALNAHIAETIRLTAQMLAQADVQPNQIERVLLVGQATQMPLIRSQLREYISCEQVLLPADAVARGAAYYSVRLGQCYRLTSPSAPIGSQLPTAPVAPIVSQSSSAPAALADRSSPAPAAPQGAAGYLPERLSAPWQAVKQALDANALDQAIQSYKAFLDAAEADLSDIYRRRAAQLEAINKWDEALKLLQEANDLCPSNPLVKSKLDGMTAEKCAREALEWLNRAKASPANWRKNRDKCRELVSKSLRHDANNQLAKRIFEELARTARPGR
jgi:molecular chaperone DnaK (HSP70)